MQKTKIAAVTAAGLMALPAAAGAHVTIQPDRAPAGSVHAPGRPRAQ